MRVSTLARNQFFNYPARAYSQPALSASSSFIMLINSITVDSNRICKKEDDDRQKPSLLSYPVNICPSQLIPPCSSFNLQLNPCERFTERVTLPPCPRNFSPSSL